MRQAADFITLATRDLDAARTFYRDGLGWTPLLDVPGEIIFFQIGFGLTLGLFDAVKFAGDLADGSQPPPISGLTLSHNVAGEDEVIAVIEAARVAGATIVKEPQRAAFGGFHAHFADPNGLIWEIAHNPGWSVTEDGTVILAVVEE